MHRRVRRAALGPRRRRGRSRAGGGSRCARCARRPALAWSASPTLGSRMPATARTGARAPRSARSRLCRRVDADHSGTPRGSAAVEQRGAGAPTPSVGGTASSRSTTTRRPRSRALATTSGRSPGAYSQVERRDSQRALRAQRGDPVRGQPGSGEDLRGVGAVRAARPADRARGLGEAEEDVLHAERAEFGVVDGGDGAERRVLRVVMTSRTSWIGATAASAFSNAADDLVAGACGDPAADGLVEQVGVLRRARPPVANHGSSISSGRPTRRITRSAIDWAQVETATQRPSARAVGVAGRVVGRAVAGARLDDSRAGRTRWAAGRAR